MAATTPIGKKNFYTNNESIQKQALIYHKDKLISSIRSKNFASLVETLRRDYQWKPGNDDRIKKALSELTPKKIEVLLEKNGLSTIALKVCLQAAPKLSISSGSPFIDDPASLLEESSTAAHLREQALRSAEKDEGWEMVDSSEEFLTSVSVLSTYLQINNSSEKKIGSDIYEKLLFEIDPKEFVKILLEEYSDLNQISKLSISLYEMIRGSSDESKKAIRDLVSGLKKSAEQVHFAQKVKPVREEMENRLQVDIKLINIAIKQAVEDKLNTIPMTVTKDFPRFLPRLTLDEVMCADKDKDGRIDSVRKFVDNFPKEEKLTDECRKNLFDKLLVLQTQTLSCPAFTALKLYFYEEFRCSLQSDELDGGGYNIVWNQNGYFDVSLDFTFPVAEAFKEDKLVGKLTAISNFKLIPSGHDWVLASSEKKNVVKYRGLFE